MKSEAETHTPTIHISAKYGEIAESVLMPGDPVRAGIIAEKYLEDVKRVSSVRGINVYTGQYKEKRLSVMASGMGAGSMGIYSYELFHYYDVEKIIRVGSAGGLSPRLKLRDVVIGVSSSTDTGFSRQYQLPGEFSPCCDFSLARAAVEYGERHNISCMAGMLFSGAAFHYDDGMLRQWEAAGALAVEMESAALYMNAAHAGKRALTLCTISDMVFSGEKCSIQERQESFDDMIRMALEIA